MTAELALSTDIHVITAEINAYKRVAGEAIFEIGKRLKHVRDTLRYGEYDRWCRDSISFTRSTANKAIQAFEQLGNDATSRQLDVGKIFEMLSLPPDIDRSEFVSTPHTIPSTGEVKTVDEMTVRELREVKAELKRQQERVANVADENEVLRCTVESLAAASPRVVADPLMSDRLKRYEAKYGDIDGQVTDRITNQTEVTGAAVHFADDVQTFLLSYAHLTTFHAVFAGIPDEAYDEYRTSLDALKQFVNGMERVMSLTPRGKAEVIDIADYRAI